ncbi:MULTISPECIES: hypothetical protein [unclassified Lentimonas]|uniref:hypothetical protein n=1 Tax=unclassified Lentimonas TaxID=2630993 RepID=UPI00132C6FE3|nr:MULTISPECIES: hypothetical protein [unclassified Lentimonas]CAA6678732.1 Unannotated [Lentimonas sp. CC4]CAA6683718.1 Unannotated [Lentimonas sp. CC6]CAA6691356.1 Unannotated [Lentimonas sp. CC19]CAA6694907.1 Unannotated [Lentimonas sp. CC10]CAA7071902.1 Unannotated [Lentimonas sp. CC11]
MSIHILTQNSEVKTRLGAFLDEMGKKYVFHDTLLTLEKKLSRLKKTDAVFYDLQLEEHIWAFEPIYLGSRKTHMVVFEPSDTGSVNYSPMGNEHFLILSKDDARTKKRLITLFHELTKLSAPRKAAKKKAKKKAVAKKKATSQTTDATATTPVAEAPVAAVTQTTRYLQANSDAMKHFAAELKEAAGKHKFTMLQGEDGAEFELAARELNFQANGDISPLIVFDPMNLKSQELEELAESAMAAKVTQYCYLGLTLELNSQSVSEIASFLGHLKMQLKEQDTYLHLIIGHEIESESCFPDNIRPTLDAVRGTSHLLQIPGMASRADDISAIAHSIFSMLRMAHPFLQARSIDSSAIKHLEAECAELDYSRITRVLRNAMALGRSPTLTKDELLSFRDNSPTTQHLMESLADEKYYPSAPQ